MSSGDIRADETSLDGVDVAVESDDPDAEQDTAGLVAAGDRKPAVPDSDLPPVPL